MTYEKAASVILNVWNDYQDWDTPPQAEITGDSGFDIAMRMAYDALMEKDRMEQIVDKLCELGCTSFRITDVKQFDDMVVGDDQE